MEMDQNMSWWAKLIEKYYSWKDAHTSKNPVNRKIYLRLCFLAIFGVNQFYAGHFWKGLGYLAICWTGIPLALGLTDWMAAVPMQADENGNILI